MIEYNIKPLGSSICLTDAGLTLLDTIRCAFLVMWTDGGLEVEWGMAY